jgi:hypothetical protein
VAASCDTAMQALLDGRWLEWRGLPGDCSLSALDRLLGGSTVLDAEDALGAERTRCTRSSMNDAPLVVWHRGDELLLVELDMLSAPAKAPVLGDETVHRLDVAWGAATLKGGEWVLPERGLALLVTSSRKVVGCLGFAPVSLERYVATLRPQREMQVPPPAQRGLKRRPS